MIALVAAACGAADDSAGRSATTVASTTTGSTTSSTSEASAATSTSVASRTDPQPCSGEGYTTAPDWESGSVPDGFTLDESSTYVEQPVAGHDSLTTFLLLHLDADGRVLADLVLNRWGDLDQYEPDPALSAGFSIAETGADSVRGHAGQVVRVVNRGDSAGHAVARWVEDGAGWAASSKMLDLQPLADVLDRLLLDGEVADPTGEFVLLGRSSRFAEEQRTTRIILSGPGSPSGTRLVFEIRRSATDDSGITDLHPNRHPTGALVSDRDGTPVLQQPGVTITTLDDGAVVSLEESTSGGSLPAFDEAGRLALIDQLRRVDPETWWAAGHPGAASLCREDGGG